MLEAGTFTRDTGLTPLSLFNRLVLEQGTSFASLGRSLTLASNVVRKVLSLVRLRLFKPLPLGMGFLTNP
jgi:hypothetical protein